MYLLSRASIYLYVLIFYPVIVNMFLNKNARRNTLFYVILLNAILTALFGLLSNKITLNGMVVPTIFIIGIMTAIFLICGIILLVKTPIKIQEYDTLLETDSERIELIIKTEANWRIVYIISLVIFVFSLILYMYFTFIHKANEIDPVLTIWVLALLGANCTTWQLCRSSLKKIIKI